MGTRHRHGVGLFLGLCLVLALFAGTASAGPAKGAKWTVMVYLDADNNLDPWAYIDVEEMMNVGSSSSMNIVVLWDKYTGPAYLYKVLLGGIEVVRGFSLNGKEANMGSGETLDAFVHFTTSKFPAERYVLVLWDHGDDFRFMAYDEHPSEGAEGTDYMTHQEISAALSDVHLDVLAFDGCGMGNLEVSYEYAAVGLSIDFLLASETYVPLQGFEYTSVLRVLADNPGIPTYDFATAAVDSYVASYGGGGWQAGLGVIAMAEMKALVASLGDLVGTLAANMEMYREAAASARGEAMQGWSWYGWEAYVDFPTWLITVRGLLATDPTVAPLADAVLARLEAAVPYVRNTHALEVKGAGGLGVFFPGSAGSFKNCMWWRGEYYLIMKFPHEGWFGFLESYWGIS